MADYFIEQGQYARALKLYDDAILAAEDPSDADWAAMHRFNHAAELEGVKYVRILVGLLKFDNTFCD